MRFLQTGVHLRRPCVAPQFRFPPRWLKVAKPQYGVHAIAGERKGNTEWEEHYGHDRKNIAATVVTRLTFEFSGREARISLLIRWNEQ